MDRTSHTLVTHTLYETLGKPNSTHCRFFNGKLYCDVIKPKENQLFLQCITEWRILKKGSCSFSLSLSYVKMYLTGLNT